MIEQLTLPVRLLDESRFANFFVNGNEHLVNELRETVLGQGQTILFIYGNKGVGCTHVLQACCHLAREFHKQTFYLCLTNPGLTCEALYNLEQMDVVCLDGVEAVMGDTDWEVQLFHLFNRMRDLGKALIIASTKSPKQLECKLPDLKSRLQWGLVMPVAELSDEDKVLALGLRAQLRGFELPEEVGLFLLKRYSRNMHDLIAIFERLDQASLQEQRKLTIPFVKKILDINVEEIEVE